MKTDGSGYDSTWVTGLHAPKGMGLYGNRLYVADLGNVVVINTQNGNIEKRIAVDGATGLNDVTVTDNGVVYVSDSRTAKVWRLERDQPSLYLDNMQGVNGLKAVGTDLLVASGKNFIKVDDSKAQVKFADLPQGGDGVEPVGNGDYLVTSWGGYIFYVAADGKVTTLLETHADKKNTADIGYDPKQRIMYVPTFFARTVAAYRLK
jgi:sugar lactone lactonase YvrE